MLLFGIIQLPWWGYVALGLGLTHLSIVAVTIFLHRHQTHRALDLHPAASHAFRFWIWFTTAMVTREWVAVHRKHHAKCETSDDPHSPQIYGIMRLLTRGVVLYANEKTNPETIAVYGRGTPDDWVERRLYARFPNLGISLLGTLQCVVFGLVPGGLLFIVQMAWIPFWASGVINGVGHFWGYRNYRLDNASRNIVPWGILIGGEELHNNHHASPASAKLSSTWFEFDIGWMYIRILSALRLARVHVRADTPRARRGDRMHGHPRHAHGRRRRADPLQRAEPVVASVRSDA